MSSAPPLIGQILDLNAEVEKMSAARGLGPDDRRAALMVLGRVVADGERSPSRALERVKEMLDGDRDAMRQLAAEIERGGAKMRFKPQPEEQQRWDL